MSLTDETRVDVALVEGIVARDERAVAALYERHSRMLFGLLRRILGDRSEAEDVLQEVFLCVWTRAETYNVALGSPAGWLVRIARNRGIDRLRAKGVRERAAEAAYPSPVVDSPELRAAKGEQQRAVARALDALPADQRVLIEQAYFFGLTHSELAARFCLPLGTVKTRIRSAMLALRDESQRAYIGQ